MEFYKILGIATDASDSDVRKAYRKLARELHPNKHPGQSMEMFRKISEAYEVLSDPEKRRNYDRKSMTSLRNFQSNVKFRDPLIVFDEFFSTYSMFHDHPELTGSKILDKKDEEDLLRSPNQNISLSASNSMPDIKFPQPRKESFTVSFPCKAPFTN